MFLWQQILFIRIASFLGEWPRSTASVQRLSEAYEACSLSEAALLFLPVLFTGLLKQTCSEFSFIELAIYWTLVSQLLPAHLADAISFSKSLLELFLKHCLLRVIRQDHTGLVLSASQVIFREEIVTWQTLFCSFFKNTKTSDHFWTQLKR